MDAIHGRGVRLHILVRGWGVAWLVSAPGLAGGVILAWGVR